MTWLFIGCIDNDEILEVLSSIEEMSLYSRLKVDFNLWRHRPSNEIRPVIRIKCSAKDKYEIVEALGLKRIPNRGCMVYTRNEYIRKLYSEKGGVVGHAFENL